MAQQVAFAGQRRQAARASRGALFLAGVALVWLTVGLVLLARQAFGEPRPYQPAAGMLLMGLAVVPLRLGQRIRHVPGDAVRLDLLRRPLYWRWTVSGLAGCVLLGLLLGPTPGGVYLLAVSVAACLTAALVPLFAPRDWLDLWLVMDRSRSARLLQAAALALLALLLAAEAALRGIDLVVAGYSPLSPVVDSPRLVPGTVYRGRTVNRQGYWDDEFDRRPRAGKFRIAVLGDEATLSGDSRSNFLVQIERSVPGIELYHCGAPQAGPRHYVVRLVEDVLRYRPDLVLAFVSVADDIIEPAPSPACLGWQSLRLRRWTSRLWPAAAWSDDCCAQHDACPALSGAADYEGYLHGCSHQLAVCRTPIAPEIERRWQDAFSHLDQLVRQCRRRDIAVALVIVPAEFQTNLQLCNTLRRRLDYPAEQLDLDLPQRRLAGFADQRQVALFDLLPHVRRAEPPPYLRHSGEWSDSGQDLAATALGNWLQSGYGTLIAAHGQASADAR